MDYLTTWRSADISKIYPIFSRIDSGRVCCRMWMGAIGSDSGKTDVCDLGLILKSSSSEKSVQKIVDKNNLL